MQDLQAPGFVKERKQCSFVWRSQLVRSSRSEPRPTQYARYARKVRFMAVRLSPDLFRHALREPLGLITRREVRGAFFAGGGLLAAIAASACCVLPLAFGALGLGGAWLSSLTAVAPYRTPIRVLAIVLLGAGFWLVYARRTTAREGAACPTAPSQRLTKTLLWLGLFVIIVVLSADWWVPLVT
jgi:mercuric ion transport protein